MSLKKLRLYKHIIYDITITCFIKTPFWTSKLIWKISLKNSDISIFVLFAWIVSLIFLLDNLITFSKLEKSWKITVFRYFSKIMLTSSHFHQHLGSKRYVVEFTIGLAMCILRFLTLTQADQILSGGMICPPRLWVINNPE